MSESKNLAEIQLNAPKEMTLWRNNSGLAVYNKNGKTWSVRYGVGGDGGSDLIGVCKMKITEDMVGETIGVFVGCEVKTENGVKKKHQKHFIEFLKNAGCIALFATSSKDLIKELDSFKNRTYSPHNNKGE